jgi:hypothetical protein
MHVHVKKYVQHVHVKKYVQHVHVCCHAAWWSTCALGGKAATFLMFEAPALSTNLQCTALAHALVASTPADLL